VTGLEDARVAARPRGKLRTDLLEELVRRFTLGDVLASEPTRMERAGAGLGDELLDEGAEFLRLGFGRFDRAGLDQRGSEIAEQRETLLTAYIFCDCSY